VAQATYEYKPLKFFVMTFVVTWTPWFIGAHLSSQKGMEAAGLLLNLIGLLGPLAMALFMVFGSGSIALKGRFQRSSHQSAPDQARTRNCLGGSAVRDYRRVDCSFSAAG
jgi:hypothetical protein